MTTNKIYIKDDLKQQLCNLNCGFNQDYIEVYRREGSKVFFKYGKCKLHITDEELENYRIEDTTTI